MTNHDFLGLLSPHPSVRINYPNIFMWPLLWELFYILAFKKDYFSKLGKQYEETGQS